MCEAKPHVLLDVLWKHLPGRRVSGWAETARAWARTRLSSAPRVPSSPLFRSRRNNQIKQEAPISKSRLPSPRNQDSDWGRGLLFPPLSLSFFASLTTLPTSSRVPRLSERPDHYCFFFLSQTLEDLVSSQSANHLGEITFICFKVYLFSVHTLTYATMRV